VVVNPYMMDLSEAFGIWRCRYYGMYLPNQVVW